MQMNLRQLVQRAYRECGLTGDGPSTVLNQSGRSNDVIRCVLQAFEEVQVARTDWAWDWRRTAFALTNGVDSYDPVTAPAFNISSGVRAWVRDGAYVYRSSLGETSRNWLEWEEWQAFRTRGVPVVNSQPVLFSTAPDETLRYFPRPNQDDFIAVHEYWLKPQTLAADTDVPRMPAEYHMAIVWKAVMGYAQTYKDWTRHDSAEERYLRMLAQMVDTHTSPIMVGGPLA